MMYRRLFRQKKSACSLPHTAGRWKTSVKSKLQSTLAQSRLRIFFALMRTSCFDGLQQLCDRWRSTVDAFWMRLVYAVMARPSHRHADQHTQAFFIYDLRSCLLSLCPVKFPLDEGNSLLEVVQRHVTDWMRSTTCRQYQERKKLMMTKAAEFQRMAAKKHVYGTGTITCSWLSFPKFRNIMLSVRRPGYVRAQLSARRWMCKGS